MSVTKTNTLLCNFLCSLWFLWNIPWLNKHWLLVKHWKLMYFYKTEIGCHKKSPTGYNFKIWLQIFCHISESPVLLFDILSRVYYRTDSGKAIKVFIMFYILNLKGLVVSWTHVRWTISQHWTLHEIILNTMKLAKSID